MTALTCLPLSLLPEPTTKPPPFRFAEKGEKEPASATNNRKTKHCPSRAGMQNGTSASQGQGVTKDNQPASATHNRKSQTSPRECRHAKRNLRPARAPPIPLPADLRPAQDLRAAYCYRARQTQRPADTRDHNDKRGTVPTAKQPGGLKGEEVVL